MNDAEEHWLGILSLAFSPDVDPESKVGIHAYLRSCSLGSRNFHTWAQSLPPEEAAKLFALLSAPEVPTDTSSGSGSP